MGRGWKVRGETNQLVNENEHVRLGMLSGLDIAVYGDPPSTILNDLGITIQTVGRGGVLGAQDEDINTAEAGKHVQCVSDILANHDTILGIHNETMVNVDRGTLLQNVSGQRIGAGTCPGRLLMRTNAKGVLLKMVSRLLCTSSGAPERQTVVVWPLRCFGALDKTWASTGRGPLVSSWHRSRRLLRFVV